ncbi:MAG: hypothetical protein JKY54_14650 [Flavobacteriales bacterium]|nr:hypothetical protein [Flavobacteriales bacterium]
MKHALLICYIILAGIGVFLINNLYILIAIILAHLIGWFILKIPVNKLKFLWKIKWFVLIIVFFHSISGPDPELVLLAFKKIKLSVGLAGLENGLIMAGKLISMLLITQLVRLSMSKAAFVSGMRKLGLSHDFADIIDQIFGIITSSGQGNGKGKGDKKKGSGKNKELMDTTARQAMVGKIGSIPDKLAQRLNKAKDQFKNSPNAVIGASSLTVTLIRMVKIAPGFPLAPGHKNILLVPVFIQAIHGSNQRFTGAKIGFISGILHFASGFGKYGPLGILQFLLLGSVIGAMMKLMGKNPGTFKLSLVGATAGLTRISSEIILSFALGMPKAFYLLYLPYFISQILFGAGSCFISKKLISKSATTTNE